MPDTVPLADEAGDIGRSAQRRHSIEQATSHREIVKLRRSIDTLNNRLAEQQKKWTAMRYRMFGRLLARRTLDREEVYDRGDLVWTSFHVAADSVWLESARPKIIDTYSDGLTVTVIRPSPRAYAVLLVAPGLTAFKRALRALGVDTGVLRVTAVGAGVGLPVGTPDTIERLFRDQS